MRPCRAVKEIIVEQVHIASGEYTTVFLHMIKGGILPFEIHITPEGNARICLRDKDKDKIEVTTYEEVYH